VLGRRTMISIRSVVKLTCKSPGASRRIYESSRSSEVTNKSRFSATIPNSPGKRRIKPLSGEGSYKDVEFRKLSRHLPLASLMTEVDNSQDQAVFFKVLLCWCL
jgi:hypothetical protein